MKQYKVDNLGSKIEKDDILQVKEGDRDNKQIKNNQRQEDIQR